MPQTLSHALPDDYVFKALMCENLEVLGIGEEFRGVVGRF
jgi:hypothetical protein